MNDLSKELFQNTSELFNRAYDQKPENLPARAADDMANMSCKSGCQCVSCRSSGCNK